MKTEIFITNPSKTKAFSLFKIGDFVVDPNSKYVGVKYDDHTVLFFEQKNRPGAGSACNCVPGTHQYLVPTEVIVDITL